MRSRRLENYLIAGFFMSLAWSLRGQFGHLKGAAIPGAVAALLPLLLLGGSWRASTGIALILSSLGFALGGHLSYGRLIETVQFSYLSECIPQLLKIFLIGGVWGGLGATFLGYGFSEKPFSRLDFSAIFAVWIFWYVTLGVMNLRSYDILILYIGFAVLQLFNYRVKKSKLVFDFGFGGMVFFGISFVAAILLLNFGRRGWLPGHWPWWGLRDQMIGFLGGISLWAIAERSQRNKTLPALGNDSVSLHKTGVIFYAVLIPAVNSMNVLSHWLRYRTVSHPDIIAIMLIALFFTLMFLFFLNKWEMFSIHLEKTLRSTSIFFIWYLSLIAILKEWAVRGRSGFETAQLLFVFFAVLLTFFILRKPNETPRIKKAGDRV